MPLPALEQSNRACAGGGGAGRQITGGMPEVVVRRSRVGHPAAPRIVNSTWRIDALRESLVMSCLVTLLLANLTADRAQPAGKTIPFEMLGHLVLVRASINGSEMDYNFVVDTGGVACIDKGLAGELGLKEKGPMAKIDSLGLSGLNIEKVFCFTTFDFGHFDALGTPIHGMIGSNLLERYRVTFDFEDQTITFSGDTTSMEAPEEGMLLEFDSHPVNSAPVVDLEICGKSLKGMIDTGQPYPVVLPLGSFEEYRDSCAVDYTKSKGLMEEWPMTNPDHNYLARLASLELSRAKLDSVTCLFGELPPPLSMPLIGNDFLSHFEMVIDYPSRRLLLIPYEDARFEKNVFSAGLRPDISAENQIVVKGVWESSPADRAGIEVGDRILSFDSRGVTPANLIELIGLLEDDSTESVTLEILQGDTPREVRLVKTMLLGGNRR